jgi:hypothetical protein
MVSAWLGPVVGCVQAATLNAAHVATDPKLIDAVDSALGVLKRRFVVLS